MNSLENRLAVITGGATGIGRGIASVLISRGARVAVIQKDPALLENMPASIRGFLADIADRAAVERTVDAIIGECGDIDILVNNASLTGKRAIAPFLESTGEQLDLIVDTNLKGTFHVSQAVAKHMVKRGRKGSIVHIASVGAYAAQEFASAYCATKAAQVSLAQSMALELAPYGIRVNTVAAGDIYTEANATVVSDLAEAGATGRYIRHTPLGRRGTPEEVGYAVAYLVSDEASFVTGSTLLADGGFLAY